MRNLHRIKKCATPFGSTLSRVRNAISVLQLFGEQDDAFVEMTIRCKRVKDLYVCGLADWLIDYEDILKFVSDRVIIFNQVYQFRKVFLMVP